MEIEDNALAARLKYAGATLDLEGRVAEISYEGTVTLLGTPGTSIPVLWAGGADTQVALTRLHRGQSVVLRCTFLGKNPAPPRLVLSSVITGG
jgi:hypothetical protein